MGVKGGLTRFPEFSDLEIYPSWLPPVILSSVCHQLISGLVHNAFLQVAKPGFLPQAFYLPAKVLLLPPFH